MPAEVWTFLTPPPFRKQQNTAKYSTNIYSLFSSFIYLQTKGLNYILSYFPESCGHGKQRTSYQKAVIRLQQRICNPFTFRTRVAIWQEPFLPTPCSTCMAGKWISIYGSISLIIAHSFLSGPESTLAAEHWSAPKDGLMASNLPGRWRLFCWYYQVNSITVTVDFLSCCFGLVTCPSPAYTMP